MITDKLLDKWVEDLQDEIDENWTHGAVGTDDTEPDPSHEELFAEVLRKERQDYQRDFMLDNRQKINWNKQRVYMAMGGVAFALAVVPLMVYYIG